MASVFVAIILVLLGRLISLDGRLSLEFDHEVLLLLLVADLLEIVDLLLVEIVEIITIAKLALLFDAAAATTQHQISTGIIDIWFSLMIQNSRRLVAICTLAIAYCQPLPFLVLLLNM